jgi:hypothetical protein
MVTRVCALAILTTCGCSHESTFAPTSITPQQVLTRYSGVADRCRKSGVYYVKYRTKTNLGDTVDSVLYGSRGIRNVPNFRRIVSTHGVRGEQGRLSDRSWAQTVNGLVLPNTSPSTVFDRLVNMAAHKADPRVRMLGIKTTGGRRYYVLEIAPNARVLQRRYYESGTFLLRETQTQNYDRDVTTDTISRYVTICGKPVPARVDLSHSLSAETTETTLVRFGRSEDRSLLAVPASKTPFVPQYRLPMTLNSLFSPSAILIRVDIRGQPYWFQLDSGAGDVTLDRDFVRRLGGHEFGEFFATKGGAVRYGNAIIPRLDIGPVYARNLVVSIIDHDYIEDGVHVVGLLGCDFIGSRPIIIDFHSEKVIVLNALPRALPGWTSVQTPLDACRPSIRTRIENQSATLMLDTGSPYTIINEDIYDRISASVNDLGPTRVAFIGAQILAARQYGAPDAFAGSLSLGPLVVSVVAEGRGQDLNNDGILGLNVLRNYRLVLDYKHARTYFQKYPAN